MKHFLLSALFLSTSLYLNAQRSTFSNYSGDWNSSASWSDGLSTTDDEDDDFIINGYITNTGTQLTITGDITVNDTLVVEGDFNMDENGGTLTVGLNGVLIVLGDFDFANQLNIDNEGVIAVGGTFDKDGSANQGSFTGSGKVYANSYGSVGGPGNPDTGDWVDDETGNTSQSESVVDLTGDGLSEIEEFIIDNGINPLPVDLLYFQIELKEHIVIEWATATEINNDHFIIERSEDGTHFYEIGRINGNGNSNDLITYSFEDKFVLAEIEYYRLKQVDHDGQFEYFQTKRIETEGKGESISLQAYPTIVRNGFITVSSNHPLQISTIEVYSISGKQNIDLQQRTLQENPLNYVVNLSDLQRGFYIFRLTSSSGKELSTRVILE